MYRTLTVPVALLPVPTCRHPFNPRPSHRHYQYDGDRQTEKLAATDAPGVAGAANAKPAYGADWPECPGKCLDGRCVLPFHHPECCVIRGDDYQNNNRHSDYGGYPAAVDQPAADAANAQASPARDKGYWHTHDLFCWE